MGKTLTAKHYAKAEYTIRYSGYSNCIELSDFIFKLNSNGVYIFSSSENMTDSDNIVYYVGFSTALCVRVLESLNTRMKDKHNNFYVHILDNYNTTDSAIIEIMLINKFAPTYNKASKYAEQSTLISSIDLSKTKKIKIKYD